MSYPLFDSGYILWIGDLDAALMNLHGLSVRALGVEPRKLLDSYYNGVSVTNALATLTEHGRLSRAS